MKSRGHYIFLTLICLCALYTRIHEVIANGNSLSSQNPLQYAERCVWMTRGGNMSSAADMCADSGGSVLTLNDTESGTVILNRLGISGSPVYVTIDSGWLAQNDGWSSDKESHINATCVKLLNGQFSAENCTTEMTVTICESSELVHCDLDLENVTDHETSKQSTVSSIRNKTAITPKFPPLATISSSTTTKIATLLTTTSRATPAPTTPKETPAPTTPKETPASTTPKETPAPTTPKETPASTTTIIATSATSGSKATLTTTASKAPSTTSSRKTTTTTAVRRTSITRGTSTAKATIATTKHGGLNEVIKQPETKQGIVPFNDMPLPNITTINENSTAATTNHVFSETSQVDSLEPVSHITIATTSTATKTPVIDPFEILQIPSVNGTRNVSLDNFLSEIIGRSNISEASHTTIKPVPPCNVTIAAPDSLHNSSRANQTSNHGGPPVTDVKFQVSGMNNGSVKPWTGGNAQLPQTGSHVTSPKTHIISKVLNGFKQVEHVDNSTLQEFVYTVNSVEKDTHIAGETDDVKTMILEEFMDVGEHLIAKIPVSMKTVVITTDGMGLVSKVISPEKDDNRSTVDFRSAHQTTNIKLSKKIFDSRDSTEEVRVSALTYRKMDELSKASNKHISSNVVSVTVHYIADNISETGVIKVDNAIFFEMKTDVDVNKHEDRRLCTFWDFKQREWSTAGCDVMGKNNSYTSCQCNHLTSFAILVMYVETEDISVQNEHALFTMTTVGCSLSIACLVMTLICYIYLRILPNEKIMIHANLSVALLLAQIVFVSSSDAYKDPTACKVVAVLLHFLFLASFTWMMVEGIALYLCCTKGIFQHRDMRNLYFLLGWGLPLLIVVISLAARFPNYGTGPQYSCWLSVKDGLIWAFLGPMLIIVLMNIGVMGLVVKVFLTLRANADKTEVARLRGSLRAMLTLLPLLGVTWIFSLLVPFSVVFHYFFVITNTVQGMCIFFLHCICNEEIRKKFYEKRRKWSTTRTGSDADMTFSSRRKTGSFDAIRAAPPATQLPAEYATRTAWA